MGWIVTIGRILYDAAHLTAVFLTSFLIAPVLALERLGFGVWVMSALWLALLLLDWTGRWNLHGSLGKLAAALVLPAVLGSGEMLFREGSVSLGVYLCFFLLILLLGSILLRGPGGEARQQAELFLEMGCELAISEVIWLHLLGGAVVLVAVFGLILVLILGELMAQNGSLFDYGGLAGVLLGLLVLHLNQVLMFLRGLRLAKKKAPDQVGWWSAVLLWIPIVNLFWAGRLKSRLWNDRMNEEIPLWTQL